MQHNAVTSAPTVWVAYYSDFSGLALFAEKIDALRYAVGSSMGCKQVALGTDLLKQLR